MIGALGDFIGSDESAKHFKQAYEQAARNATTAINTLASVLSTHTHDPKDMLKPPIEDSGPLPAPPGRDKAGIAERLDDMAATGEAAEWAGTLPRTSSPAAPFRPANGTPSADH